MDRTLVTGCGCLGLCERGPNVVIYPEGRWYTSVQPDEAEAIVLRGNPFRYGALAGAPESDESSASIGLENATGGHGVAVS